MSAANNHGARAENRRISAAEVGLSSGRLTGDKASKSPMSSPHVDVSPRLTTKWICLEHSDCCLLRDTAGYPNRDHQHNQHVNAHQRRATALSGCQHQLPHLWMPETSTLPRCFTPHELLSTDALTTGNFAPSHRNFGHCTRVERGTIPRVTHAASASGDSRAVTQDQTLLNLDPWTAIL